MNLNEFPETIICDIDGCILKHQGDLCNMNCNSPELLPNVKEMFDSWDKKGNRIVLLTGRKESMREITEKQLKSFGLFWDFLIMGATRGRRVLINDKKPNIKEDTAIAINLIRDKGL